MPADVPDSIASPSGLRPRRVAVIGAGPSGIFAAQALTGQTTVPVEVDIFDRLPTPFGLLRYGVAPDHTGIKAVAHALAKVFECGRVTFLGMVEFGSDVVRDELLTAYDAVIYAVGAAEDLHLNIPGEGLLGSQSAREFVAWYSGHPDARPQELAEVKTAVTFGVGNVAVDVARILLKNVAQLETTDMPDEVLDELRSDQIQDLWIIGRRGLQHASFTTQELRELVSDPQLEVILHPGVLDGLEEVTLERRVRANIDALREAATRTVERPRGRLHILFWHRPIEILGSGRVEQVVVERTALDAEGSVVGTGEFMTIPAELCLRAIGYRGKPLPDVPFDQARGVIPNSLGRVCDLEGVVCPREYAVGWVKRGAVGVIGTNKTDAAETVRSILEDWETADWPELTDIREVMAARGFEPTSFDDWRRIDAAEVDRGEERGRVRTKIAGWHELVHLIDHGEPGGYIAADGLLPDSVL